jgi:peroxiredoxin
MKMLSILLSLCALAAGAAEFAGSALAQGARSAPVAVGETAPAFDLLDQTGRSVRFAPGSDTTPTVLVFYRGSWCPFCVRQLSELRSLLQPGEKVRLLAISIDPADASAKVAKKLASDGKGSFDLTLLSDPGHKVIDAYGVRNRQHDGEEFAGIPHPAVYVVDGAGVVRWMSIDEDYKKRPSNEEIRKALEALR